MKKQGGPQTHNKRGKRVSIGNSSENSTMGNPTANRALKKNKCLSNGAKKEIMQRDPTHAEKVCFLKKGTGAIPEKQPRSQKRPNE